MNTRLANWTAPKNITALTTTRCSGFSASPYETNNLGLHVGDDEACVLLNRAQLVSALHLPGEPQWLNQTHSTDCVVVENDLCRNADAAISQSAKHPLVIMTADCLPVTLCNQQGTEIAAIHAGWKGLCNGIIENTIDKMESKPTQLMAWIGPGICQNCYEVGEEMYFSFTNKLPESKMAFRAKNSKWMANLAQLAELILNLQGVKAVFQSNLCTYELKNEFYSYRRASQTGRIGTLIWFNQPHQD